MPDITNLYELELDVSLARLNPAQVVTVRAGDVGSCTIRCTVLEDGDEVDLDGLDVELRMTKSDATVVTQTCSVAGSVATVTLGSQAVSSPGRTLVCFFHITDGNGWSVSTEGFTINVLYTVDITAEESESWSDRLDTLSARYQAALAAVEGAAAAEAARASAETARATAEQQRATAEQARSGIEGQRVLAEQSRITAEGARATAEQKRATAEQARAEAEQDRADAWDELVATAAHAVEVAEQAVEMNLRFHFAIHDGLLCIVDEDPDETEEEE